MGCDMLDVDLPETSLIERGGWTVIVGIKWVCYIGISREMEKSSSQFSSVRLRIHFSFALFASGLRPGQSVHIGEDKDALFPYKSIVLSLSEVLQQCFHLLPVAHPSQLMAQIILHSSSFRTIHAPEGFRRR